VVDSAGEGDQQQEMEEDVEGNQGDDEEEMEEDEDEEMEEDVEDQGNEMRNFFPIYISQDRAIDWVYRLLEKRYPSLVDVSQISSTFTSFGETKESLRRDNSFTKERTNEVVLRMRSKLAVPIGYR
jgi:hypothetical protein